MVFSGLLKSMQSTPRRRSCSLQTSKYSPEQESQISSPSQELSENVSSSHYLCEEANLLHVEEPEEPDLRELNNALIALAAIFPDVQVEVFREMLSSFEEESRLAVVTETLLKHKVKWVRGRYRIDGKEKTIVLDHGEDFQPTQQGHVAAEEKFRSAKYKKTVKIIAYHEFKGLSRSTINAVLAEFNHSYTLARPTLIGLSSKSWRFSLSSLFLRRKPTSSEAEHHPLVIWQQNYPGSVVPTLKGTGSSELDKELFESLIIPIQIRMRAETADRDHAFALEINNAEAEENDSLNDCECCYTAMSFEELSSCNGEGHLICFQCIRHAVNEAIFGQGWQRSIDINTGTLRCLAAMSDDCDGCIPQLLVRRAFEEQKSGRDTLRKFDERLVEDSLLKTNLPLVRCPFCSYVEVDELYLPRTQRSWRLKRITASSFHSIPVLILGVGMIPFLLVLFLLFSCLFLLWSKPTFGEFAIRQFQSSITRLRRRQLGLKFACQNQICRRASCISCSKAWTDVHICHESSLLALRTQVELAMSLAIKRTCPRCNTSFVKSSGCNKLTCICGYQMCYVCRKDIGNGEGYRHFCEHFRPSGGRVCTDCSKCDLYRCEDDEVVVKEAKEDAERRWMEKEGMNIGSDEKVRKVLEEKWNKRRDASWLENVNWRMPNWEHVFDRLVESIVD